MSQRRLVPLFALVVLAAFAGSARADLLEYVKKPDPDYAWKIQKKTELPEGTTYDLHLVSQVWQGIKWEHQILVILPKGVKPTATMFLWNQGGKPSVTSTAFGFDLARKMNAPVAMLFGVPNQPLFNGLKEDALIAETFVQYLKTKDASWPLLFPMTKSMVRAMDALQAFAKQEWKLEITHFVVSGGSKRGWTAWLTAAVDARVKALAPCVIDTLNMQAQMPHQLRSYGKYSDMIADYTKRGLVPLPDTDDARKLWGMVDPWVYRDRIKQPKMIVNGTNDPYWTQDALNLYWNDLKGDKWILYVPNAGHNLVQKKGGVNLIPDMTRASITLAAFARHQIHDIPMPKLSWQHEGEGAKLTLKVQSDTAPKAARLWSTTGGARDFRQSKWTDRPLDVKDKSVAAEVATPAEGYVVFFAELEYEIDGLRYCLSTQLRIAGKDKEKEKKAAAKTQTVRGVALHADGKPAAGAVVKANGQGYHSERTSSEAKCAADGSFAIEVHSDEYCIFVARHDRFASALHWRVVRAGQEVEPLKFTMAPATRIHGTMTVGEKRVPLVGQFLMLVHREDNYHKLPADQRLPNPNNDRAAISPSLFAYADTDKEGRYEFLVGPGKYSIMNLAYNKQPNFEVTNQPEFEINSHADVPPIRDVAGKVFLRGNPKEAVAGAKIKGHTYEEGNNGARVRDAATEKDGTFKTTRGPASFLLQATSADGLHSGIAELKRDQSEVTIPLEPAASWRGRVVDSKSGEPLAGHLIYLMLKSRTVNTGTLLSFCETATTSSEGEFTFTGVAVGWHYLLNIVPVRDGKTSRDEFVMLAELPAEKPGAHDLGVIKVKSAAERKEDAVASSNAELQTRIDRYMESKLPLKDLLDTALGDARRANQRLLLLVGSKKHDACQQFFDMYYRSGNSTALQKWQESLANYTIVGVSDDKANKEGLYDRFDLPKHDIGAFVFVLVDSDRKLLASLPASDVMTMDKKLDFAKLGRLLDAHAPKLPDARKLLADGLAQAQRENKRVFLQHTGAFCGPCVRLSRFLDQHNKIFGKDYVVVKIDTRFVNGDEVVKRHCPEGRGIPWSAILDAKGKVLADSDEPEGGNIGFPTSPRGIAHFEKMLRSTRQHMTDAELKTMIQALAPTGS